MTDSLVFQRHLHFNRLKVLVEREREREREPAEFPVDVNSWRGYGGER